MYSQFSSVQLLSRVWLFATPWTAAHQASLSITNSWSLLKFMSIESVMPSNHFIFCRPLLLSPSIFPSLRVFSNESALRVRWPKYWSFSFGISPSNEHSGLISFGMDWLDLLAVRGTLKSLLQHHSSKASILRRSAFFTVQLSHPYMTTGKTRALTKWICTPKQRFLWHLGLQTGSLDRVLYSSWWQLCFHKCSNLRFLKTKAVSILSSKHLSAIRGCLLFSSPCCCCCSVTKSCPTLQFHRLHHTRFSWPLFPGVCSNLCPLSHWYHPTFSSCVTPFSSCLQSFPVLPSFHNFALFIGFCLLLHKMWYWSLA